jgi:hypothetical protein
MKALKLSQELLVSSRNQQWIKNSFLKVVRDGKPETILF